MELSLTAEVREELGKQKNVKIRSNGQIPGVLYGEGKPTEHITLDALEFGRFILKNGMGKLISLGIQKGNKSVKEQVLIKECQKHPVKRNFLHIDFIRVAMDHPVNLKVPVHFIGEEKRPHDGSILEVKIHELEISCLPANIPDHITVDVAKLMIGNGIHVKDLVLPQEIRVLNLMEEVVVLASSPTGNVETPKPGESTATES